ncbi:hypothetical protein [Paenibacillus xerothermodurans]|uniref:DUF2140 family protein n=1 Tax=Paenibacillus xerothermodurans TaxID=1977292 RepID=A0A2W1P0U3_PAEXE|nr:hypothetical protein [Paenibacillus xerothermodurans]PZE21362.1 hypothetical protein CBW46_008360 [Paenibacillus xerothermodurans]
MRQLLRALIGLAIILGLAAGGLYYYVQPAEPLDLNFSAISLRDELNHIMANRRLQVELSEREVDSLLKMALVTYPPQQKDIEITGARFRILNDHMIADANLLYRERWEIGATLHFTLDWKDPYLIATHTGTNIKQLQVPPGWFQLEPIRFAPNEHLPMPLAVRNIQFLERRVLVDLKVR